jgi:hypothetical protein
MAIEYDPHRSALYTPELRNTIFEAGKTYSPLQVAVEGARLAYFRAEESSPEKVRLAEALRRAGFGDPLLFTDATTGAAGFGARRSADGMALLAFRGTQPDDAGDIGIDLRANTVEWLESAGRVHAGFAAATRALKPKIQDWIQGTIPDLSNLIVTGHSLGAAMATLAASVWRPAWLVTLGSPRVGNEAFLGKVGAGKVVRIVDCCDVVTEVPPPIEGYAHLKTCTYVTRDGAVLEDPPQALIDADRLPARLEYLTKYAWRSGAVLVRDLADHAPINYARAFFGGCSAI